MTQGRRYVDKVALVTGGASGIGLATALGLAREGARIAVADRNPEAGAAAVRLLVDQGAEAAFHVIDVTQESEVQQLIADVVTRFGGLDVAINNVGGVAGGDKAGANLHESSLEAWEGTMAVSLRSIFLCMKHEIRHMLKSGGGVIANTTSMAGISVSPASSPAYVAAKAGVAHLSRWAAVQYADRNIRINAVAPGLTLTPSVARSFTDDGIREHASKFQPMNRPMRPEEIADAFLWVCSDQASGVTGLTVPVSGGWAAR